MITRDETWALLLAVIDEHPTESYADMWRAAVENDEYVNGDPMEARDPECVYSTDDGQPLCLVGQVLDKVGVLTHLHEEEQTVKCDAVGEVLHGFDYDAVQLLLKAQEAQDFHNHRPWSQIVRDLPGYAEHVPAVGDSA